MRLISKSEFIERIKPYDTDDFADKALYNFALNHIICCPTVQAIPIPQNATNGDVIKAMFPCLEKYEYEEPYTHGIALAGNDNRVTWFTNDWWNAPYEGSDAE